MALSRQGSAALSTKANRQKATGDDGKFGHLARGESNVQLGVAMPREQYLHMARTTDEELQKLQGQRVRHQSVIHEYTKMLSRGRTHPAREIEYQQKIDLAKGELAVVESKITPLNDLHDEHQWTRFIAVPGGHMHSGYSCQSIRWSTETGLMAEYSGADKDELVDMAGEFCCTHCFPDAPVNKKSMLPVHVAQREADEKTRLEKMAKVGAKTLKSADPTSPTGSFTTVINGRKQSFKTITSMSTEARYILDNALLHGFNIDWRSPAEQVAIRKEKYAEAWPLIRQAASRNSQNGSALDTPRKLAEDLWAKKIKQYVKEGAKIPPADYNLFDEFPEEAARLLDGED